MHKPSPAAATSRVAPAAEIILAHLDALPKPQSATELAHTIGPQSFAAQAVDFNHLRSGVARSLWESFVEPAGDADLSSELWRHNLAVGLAAERLISALGAHGEQVDRAFVAGALHDVGKLALAAVYPRAYRDVILAAERRRTDATSCERVVFGVDHTVIGRRLATRWGMPPWLSAAIWLHHAVADSLPSGVADGPLLGALQFADSWARERRLGLSGNYRFDEPTPVSGFGAWLDDPEVSAALEKLEPGLAQLVDDALREFPARRRAPTTSVGQTATTGSPAPELREKRALSETPRTLAERAEAAWKTFLASASARSGHAEMAVAAAQAAREAFGVLGAACVVGDNHEHLLVAWSAADGAGSRDITAPSGWPDARAARDGAFAVPDSAILRRLLISIAPCLGSGVLRALPLTYEGAAVGWIAYCGAPPGDFEFDCRDLIAGLSLCLGLGRRRAAAERLTEAMAEANHRTQIGRAEAMRSRTLATIAELAAGAGHELNGPLFVISGRAELLLQRMFDADAERSLRLIQSKALECSRIVSELMAFARPEPPLPTAVDVGELLTEVRREWTEEENWPGSRIALELEPRLLVLADRGQLKTVLLELVRNASEATADGAGVITLAAKADNDDDWGRASAPLRQGAAGRFVRLTVRDTGCGMSASVVSRAFEPFYSHRAAGRRRGLGLPRAHRVIEAHEGRIWIESAPNQGATVHILLPAPN